MHVCCANMCVRMKCMQGTLDMWTDNYTRWYVVKTFICECAWRCIMCISECASVSEIIKSAWMRKHVCLQKYHIWVRCEMHVREWVLPLVCTYVMLMCRARYGKKVRKFVCNVCEPITWRCNHAMWGCKSIV